jgi:hypothetical protein
MDSRISSSCSGFYAKQKGTAWPLSLHPEKIEGLLKRVLFNRPLMADSIILLVVLIPYFLKVRLLGASHMGAPGFW